MKDPDRHLRQALREQRHDLGAVAGHDGHRATELRKLTYPTADRDDRREQLRMPVRDVPRTVTAHRQPGEIDARRIHMEFPHRLLQAVVATHTRAMQKEDRWPARLGGVVGGNVDLIVIAPAAEGDAAIEKSGLHLLHRHSNTEHQEEHGLRSRERLIYDPITSPA